MSNDNKRAKNMKRCVRRKKARRKIKRRLDIVDSWNDGSGDYFEKRRNMLSKSHFCDCSCLVCKNPSSRKKEKHESIKARREIEKYQQ